MTTARIDLENVCSKLEMKGPQYSVFVTEVQEILHEIVKFTKTVQCLQVKVAALKPDEVGFLFYNCSNELIPARFGGLN